jgi:hypothetical protein
MKPEKLYKTTIVIWTNGEVAAKGLAQLAYEAENGDAFCSSQVTDVVTTSASFPATDFFDLPDPEPEFPKPWKVGHSPVDGVVVYAANGLTVTWEDVAEELNKKAIVADALEEILDEDQQVWHDEKGYAHSKRIEYWKDYPDYAKSGYGKF